MIRAIIFDMDGLLIDSEPLWQDAEMAVFRSVRIELTREQCLETMGLRVDEVVGYWYAKSPWEGVSREQVAADILDTVVALVKERGMAKGGVEHILGFFREQGLPIALASSSPMRLIDAVVDALDIRGYFEYLQSAETEPYGKPHPGVYITTARVMSVAPTDCLAFEDSFKRYLGGSAPG